MTSTAPPVGGVMIGLGRRARRAALAGNPNVGKSSIFNALTGLRQRVGNYPGITVERVEGSMTTPAGDVTVVDLPGTYGLAARSPDERIAREAIVGHGDDAPDVIVVVADATNLPRSLFLATQIIDAGRRVVIALNQIDIAVARGLKVDPAALSAALGVPVIPTCGRSGDGRDALVAAIASGGARGTPLTINWPPEVLTAAESFAPRLRDHIRGAGDSIVRVAQMLTSDARSSTVLGRLSGSDDPVLAALAEESRGVRDDLSAAGFDVATTAATVRYEAVDRLVARVLKGGGDARSFTRRVDRVVTHPFAGTLLMLGVFLFLFMVVFAWSGPAIDAVDTWISALGGWVRGLLGDGLFASFVQDGVIGGLGAFLVFVPQIAMLFLCIEALEDTGYLARAAFLLDRVMGFFGMPGRSFLPLLSGFACAIPAIIATRTIENRRDRFVTMAIVPLMSCQARLPVYAVLVGALFAAFGGWVPALVVLTMYVLGVVIGALCAKVMRRTILSGPRSPLLLELPPYRVPSIGAVLRNTWRRTWSFVWGAGPVILVLMMVLWAGATFPRDVQFSRDYDAEMTVLTEERDELAADSPAAGRLDEQISELEHRQSSEQLAGSYLGRSAKLMEPLIEPLGFDWKIGVAIIGSFAAREVFVPTLGVIYSVGGDADEEHEGLLASIRNDRRPDGRPVFTPLVGLALMVFYVIALQCASTLGVLKRETNSWRWPIGLFVGYTALAWIAAFAVFQIGSALGY